VSLLNTGKYGYDIKGKTMRLSLLRSPKWPDPLADRGTHRIEYSLYPHEGDWQEGNTVHRGYEVNAPLTAVAAERHRGVLPPSHSFAEITPGDLILTSIKKAEAGSDWVIQWVNLSDKPREAAVTLPAPVRSATLSNFLEESGTPVPIAGNTVRCVTPPKGVVTLRCSL
jgi:alpha-mannosidase